MWRKSKRTFLYSITLFSPKNLSIIEIMLENIVEPGRPQMTIWRMRIACWIPKATNTYSEQAIRIAFPLQQWLYEHTSLLPYMYIVLLILILYKVRKTCRSYLRAPSDYHLFPGQKKQLKGRHFRPTRRPLLQRRPGWTDNCLNFLLSGLQKLEQRAKKCIELRGEYVEEIPSLVAVTCFLPGRAKDLSAPPRRS